ncbi:MAG: type I DNA topoisomerase [Clostridia bacterium]|nr:type I DNA topoisomerase [Clostridia bacterium]
MANLVIVESPAKANTIKGYLGSSYKVIASNGHIRDLPKSTLGIDVDNGFKPHYINIRGKGDVIKDLTREAKSASKIFLATDPDREGEAISWHIAEQLGISPDTACRITFNEITKSAVKEAIKKPRRINMDLVNSQQARRILDRLVGFKLSELLWRNVKSGLSGGRVQSVAARIISDREREIADFVPQEYWTIDAVTVSESGESVAVKFFGNKKGRIKVSTEAEADAILSAVSGGTFRAVSVKHAKKYRQPAPPFETSTLQQEASKRLGFQSHKTMKVAQELYDGLNLGAEYGGVQGLITYMRTDSLRISDFAKTAAAEFISEEFGASLLPKTARSYRSGANSQDAHEAIRPSNVRLTPKRIRRLLSNDQYRLYKLIWERFVASQMAAAVLDTVSVELECGGYIFKTGGYIIKSKGYLTVYEDAAPAEDYSETEGESFSRLPDVKCGELLSLSEINKQQHFTEPPPRYTEASLIRFFKENGIGRPSTYATIISIITSREYVKRDGKTLVGTPLGEITTSFMKAHFPEIIDYEFTADMESKLDSIENKENSIEGVIGEFYAKFSEELRAAADAKEAKRALADIKEESDVPCDKCGALMIYKTGRFGKFLACPNFPACKNTKTLDKDGKVAAPKTESIVVAPFKCELCGGDMVERTGKYGSFYACANYPTCKFTKQKVTKTGVKCPICSSDVIARHGKGKMLFYSCEKYPKCDFSSWDMPLPEKCPDCAEPLYYRKSRRSVICKNRSCGYKRQEEMAVIE